MRIALLTPALIAGLSSMAVGQMTAVIPSAYAAAEAPSSTSYPWNRNVTNGHRIQYCYDSSLFSQTSPILISRLRWRANGSTSSWTGVTHPNVKIDLSSATVDQASLSTTFASNHGPDRSNVYSGNVVVAPSPTGGGTTPNIFYVDVQFSSPFLYDPSAGKDLLIDITLPGPWTNGTTSFTLDAEYNTTSPNGSRMYSLSNASSPTGSFQAGVAPVIEMTYNPATGIYANFEATPVEGKSPLQVQFTDKTYTSDPNGITKWAWDFNNDQIIDSTLQNPQHTFTGAGYDVRFTVSLTATDASNGSNTITRKDYITVNPFPVASATKFGQASTVPSGVPGPIQMPPYGRAYTFDPRGVWFQVPVATVMRSFNVPNEQNLSDQSVFVFDLGTTQPSSSLNTTAQNVLFAATGSAGTPLTPGTPIVVPAGTYIGVLAFCHDATGSSIATSYGATNAPNPSTILGQSTTLYRLTASKSAFPPNSNGTGQSIGLTTASSLPIGRVEIDVPGNLVTTFPTLEPSGDTPYFGASPQLDLTASIPGAQAGLLSASLQQIPGGAATPFGRLLITPNFLFSFVVPTGTGSIQLTIPNDPNFADVQIHWQGIIFDLTNNVFGGSNGVTWLIGQQ